MTDNEIIKALECFKSEDCLGGQCPYFEQPGLCGKPMCSDVYDFIYRQKAEIERQRAKIAVESFGYAGAKLTTDLLKKALKTAKSEAIKEFVSALKGKVVSEYEYIDIRVFKEIDALAKEMTEVKDDV